MLEILQKLKDFCGPSQTKGLADSYLQKFVKTSPDLQKALKAAASQFEKICGDEESVKILKLSEKEQIQKLQDGFVNFYAADAVNPYVALTARGPWIITTCGAVIHDSGGYGMLGLGHSPEVVIDAMSDAYPMANIMTASFSHKRLIDALHKEIGHRRPDKMRHPFAKFLCLNSGSESVTVAARLTDANAKTMTDPGGRHEGKRIMFLAFKGGFHGRTDRPAQVSDSSRKKYASALASFRDRQNLHTIPPNDMEGLEHAFQWAKENNVFFEAFFIEPVMGEGDPGKALDPHFYKRARELTKEMGSLILVDSIQAGLRTHGYLSVTDYPGFEELEAPDMETYSKALNAGQYPLSVLAMTESAAKLYQRGTYGNTMTGNPRAIEVAVTVLSNLTPELRQNIQRQGKHFLKRLNDLAASMPGGCMRKIQGTGLLFSAELDPDRFTVLGFDGIETRLRKKGIGVIHGGENSLRFTPIFDISDAEVDMIMEHLEETLKSSCIADHCLCFN